MLKKGFQCFSLKNKQTAQKQTLPTYQTAFNKIKTPVSIDCPLFVHPTNVFFFVLFGHCSMRKMANVCKYIRLLFCVQTIIHQLHRPFNQ